MSRNGSIRYQIEKELKSKCRFGESRDEAKHDGSAKYYIYSINTMKTYIKQMNHMVNWAKQNNIRLRSLDDIKEHGDTWLQYCLDQGMSAWTITTRRAALSKTLGVPYGYFKTQIPQRHRSDVKRSRDMKRSLSRFCEEKNMEQVTFCKCSGLRLSELRAITGDALFYNEMGRAGLHVTKSTKGGRHRDVVFYGSDQEIGLCIQLCQKAGENTVFEHVNKNANTHGYRAEYCKRVYEAEKRDLEALPRKDKVYCRKDKKGIVYDRQALFICSQMLGHSRSDICNLSYLY